MASGFPTDRLSVTRRFFPQSVNVKNPAAEATGWLFLAVLALIAWNVWWLQQLQAWAGVGLPHTDWSFFLGMDPRSPYSTAPGFRWSVPVAALWVWVIQPLGYGVWTLLHVVAVLTIRPWRAAGLVLLSFPFWFDLANGNVMTFAFVAAWHALQGRRAGVVAFCLIAALVPRPLMLPVLAWLLWHRLDARLAFTVGASLAIGGGLVTGTFGEWIGRLTTLSTPEILSPNNLGPSALIGAAWAPIGLALGAVLAWKGRLGLASLAVSPYLIHYYLLMAFLELRPDQPVFEGHVREVQAAGTPSDARRNA